MKSSTKTLDKIIKQLQELREDLENQQAQEIYTELIPDVISSLEELKEAEENSEEETDENEND